MISAKEAYEIATPNLDKYREFIDKRIRKAANDGKTEIMIYDAHIICGSISSKNCLRKTPMAQGS